MEWTTIGDLPVLKLGLIQTAALAAAVFFLGQAIRGRISWMLRFSIPAPVVGGLLFAGTVTLLRLRGVVGLEMDGVGQTALMIMFFTTIGMGASVRLLQKGGLPMLLFFGLACGLAVLQNLAGIAVALGMGENPLLGIVAGAVSLMGGLGTSGAFGPEFEKMGLAGGTAAGVACATFGMVAGSLMGGPFGETLIRRYRVPTPAAVGVPGEAASDPSKGDAEEQVGASGLMKALGLVLVAMGIGSVISAWLVGMKVTLPAYIGAMIVAAIFRNTADFSKRLKIDGAAVGAISEISLALYLTMAINGLKLWALFDLAFPLIAILAVQCILMALFCWLAVYLLMGRDYEAVLLAVGMMGFGMGATPNALVNMSTLSRKYGPAPKSFLIVPLVGAFLIDFANALIITGMGAWVKP